MTSRRRSKRFSFLVMAFIVAPTIAFWTHHPHSSAHRSECRSFGLCANPRDKSSDTLETLSETLSNLLSNSNQKQVLTSRLGPAQAFVNRTHVRTSTVSGAGMGLFATCDCEKGSLLTCYPGDALVENAADVTWGTQTPKDDTYLRNEYMLRAIREEWGIVAIPEVEDNDPTYLGHYANDGTEHPPANEQQLAEYVIESADKANAQHIPCQDCHMITVATRDIQEGEEIFVTYGPEYWREQQSFVPDQTMEDDFDDLEFDLEEVLDDFEFDDDFYNEAAESIVADIVSEDEPPESPTRGKGFG